MGGRVKAAGADEKSPFQGKGFWPSRPSQVSEEVSAQLGLVPHLQLCSLLEEMGKGALGPGLWLHGKPPSQLQQPSLVQETPRTHSQDRA